MTRRVTRPIATPAEQRTGTGQGLGAPETRRSASVFLLTPADPSIDVSASAPIFAGEPSSRPSTRRRWGRALTAMLGRVALVSPRLAWMIHLAGRIAWLSARMEFAALRRELAAELQLERTIIRLHRAGVFDATFYQTQFIDPLADPLRHYVRHGAKEGRWPHPLFDSPWYLMRNPDVKAAGLVPLLHYLMTWSSEGRRPNEFFDPRWYAQNHPDVAALGLDPLTHYMSAGAERLADPAPDFDSRFYRSHFPDGDAPANPLVHFLHHGRRAGLMVNRDIATSGVQVDDAQLSCLKRVVKAQETALFVTHSPDGHLKPHVRHYLEALRREGVSIVLIVASDAPFRDDEPWLRDLLGGLYVRDNAGYDFAAWAHLLRAERDISTSDIVYLLNDSLLGPTNAEDFATLMRRVRASPADIVGLTENLERGRHMQSYFLALKRGALSSFYLHQFFIEVRTLATKEEVIDSYEVKFVPRMQAAGLTAEALFKSPSERNPTIFHWRDLLDAGFPFVKVMMLRDAIPGSDIAGWREALQSHGYDVGLADALLGAARPPDGAGEAAAEHRPEISVETLPVAAAPAPDARPQTRLAFIGPWNFDNGLGVAARGYVNALMHVPFQCNISPIRPPFHIHRRVAPTIEVNNFVGPADIAVLHLNPDAWGSLLTRRQMQTIDRARRRIGLFVWESRQVPDYFIERMAACDRIWTPSQFCADAFRAVAAAPVDVVPHVVARTGQTASPAERQAMRHELGLAPNERMILYTFDATSYLVRKNPIALVRAFERSRLAAAGWRLVLKTKHLQPDIADHAALLAACASAANVTIVDRSLARAELATLTETADIYASSHCSEGFGLTVAEAMMMGKLVVATDYGGVRDFLDTDTGFPVASTEWETERDYGAYARGTVWARVDEADFAAKLHAAASLSADAAANIGVRAQNRIETLLSPAAVAKRIEASVAMTLSHQTDRAAA